MPDDLLEALPRETAPATFVGVNRAVPAYRHLTPPTRHALALLVVLAPRAPSSAHQPISIHLKKINFFIYSRPTRRYATMKKQQEEGFPICLWVPPRCNNPVRSAPKKLLCETLPV